MGGRNWSRKNPNVLVQYFLRRLSKSFQKFQIILQLGRTKQAMSVGILHVTSHSASLQLGWISGFPWMRVAFAMMSV
jgi:hypothetical protein